MIALLLGDSHTVGAYGQALATDLAAMFPDLQAVPLAVEGKGVQYWVDRLASQSPPYDPASLALVMVTLGTNDYWRDHDDWAGSVAELAAVVGEWSPTARLVWISAPVLETGDVTWQVPVLEDMLPDRWTIVDSLALTPDLTRAADGIHYPGASGQAWAQRVVDVLVSADGGTSRSTAKWWAVGTAVVVGTVAAFSFIRHLGKRR